MIFASLESQLQMHKAGSLDCYAWFGSRVDTRRELHLPHLWLSYATFSLAPLQHLHNHNRDV
jgi:hypothetical protein